MGRRNKLQRQAPASSPAQGAQSAASGEPSVDVLRVYELLDRLAHGEQSAFVITWLESLKASAVTFAPGLAVRLLRAYRDADQLESARFLAVSLPASPCGWTALDLARLAMERASLAMNGGDAAEAETQLSVAAEAITRAPPGGSTRESLDRWLICARIEADRGRVEFASDALARAQHLADACDPGAWRTRFEISMAQLRSRVGQASRAADHYVSALAGAPAGSEAALTISFSAALALADVGRTADARRHATRAVTIAAASWPAALHARACEVLARVELEAGRASESLEAIEGARGALGGAAHPGLRLSLATLEALALATLGRGAAATVAIAHAARLASDLAPRDAVEAQRLIAATVRTLEACGAFAEAVATAGAATLALPSDRVSGYLNLVVGRAALASGDSALALACVGRAAASANAHGWTFPERAASGALLRYALSAGNATVAAYAQQALRGVSENDAKTELDCSVSEPVADRVYLTTREGVTRIARADVGAVIGRYDVSFDTGSRLLVVFGETHSLVRKRALEPLVLQLLRRATEGLTVAEIAREGAGDEGGHHRARVLISRLRGLLGPAASIERVRGGPTRYRLARQLTFALVEPLVSQ